MPTKFLIFFAYYGTFGKYKSVFKDKKVIKSHKNTGNEGFSYFFCLMGGSGSVQIMTNPDPQHCLTSLRYILIIKKPQGIGLFVLRKIKWRIEKKKLKEFVQPEFT